MDIPNQINPSSYQNQFMEVKLKANRKYSSINIQKINEHQSSVNQIKQKESSNQKESQKIFFQRLSKNSYLKLTFQHYCHKMQSSSIDYFQDAKQTIQMINLNKWLLFCKQFKITQFQHFLTNKVNQNVDKQKKRINKSQNSKILMKFFYLASNYKHKISFNQFLKALYQVFKYSYSKASFQGLNDKKMESSTQLIRKFEEFLSIDSVQKFKTICEKINIISPPKQKNQNKIPLKQFAKKVNKTQNVTDRSLSKPKQRIRKNSINNAKRPSLKALFQEHPYQMNRIVKLANSQIGKFNITKQLLYNKNLSSKNKQNTYSNKHSLPRLPKSKSSNIIQQQEYSHLLSDRKYIQNTLPLGKINETKVNMKKKNQVYEEKNNNNSLQFSRLIQTIQSEKDELLQFQFQKQKKSNIYIIQERVYMKLDEQLLNVKKSCKKRLQLRFL